MLPYHALLHTLHTLIDTTDSEWRNRDEVCMCAFFARPQLQFGKWHSPTYIHLWLHTFRSSKVVMKLKPFWSASGRKNMTIAWWRSSGPIMATASRSVSSMNGMITTDNGKMNLHPVLVLWWLEGVLGNHSSVFIHKRIHTGTAPTAMNNGNSTPRVSVKDYV